MVDLDGQLAEIREEIDEAIREVLGSTRFINGPAVGRFECELAGYLGAPWVLGVANGTDALQIALMAVGVEPGDEVITSAFTFIATAEAAALLGASVAFADIDPRTFNLDPTRVESLITDRTRAIVPVHLFGQPADMDPIMEVATRHGVAVIEDNAQSVGARYGERRAGLIGAIGTLSFFPSKNLGAFGDGGAVLTNDEALYRRMKMIANHGSERKYHNEIVGVNSRLDTLQAAILSVKLKHLDAFTSRRIAAANAYDELLRDIPGVTIPHRMEGASHVFHQYTIRVSGGLKGGRDGLAERFRQSEIPFAVYYPTALHQLPVFRDGATLPETERATTEVISLPMHTELTEEQQERVASVIRSYAS